MTFQQCSDTWASAEIVVGGGGRASPKKAPHKDKKAPHRGKCPYMVKMTTHKEKNVAKRPQCGEKVAKAPPPTYREKKLGIFQGGCPCSGIRFMVSLKGNACGFALKPLSASKDHAYIICHELCYEVASLSSVVAKSVLLPLTNPNCISLTL